MPLLPRQHPSNGFQAVILCGPGTSLHPFTGAEPGDLPKALLPVANKPMLYYPLEWCEKAGFESILVLTLQEHLSAIQSYLRAWQYRRTGSSSNTATATTTTTTTTSTTSTTATTSSGIYAKCEASSSANDNLGTADVLRVAYRRGWLNADFAVVPCDLVTNLDGSRLVELWMTVQAGFDADFGRRSRKMSRTTAADGDHAFDAELGRRGGLVVFYETRGEGSTKGQETDLLVSAPLPIPPVSCAELPEGELGIVLTTAPSTASSGGGGGVGSAPDGLGLRRSMIRQHPDLHVASTLRDAGIYFLPHWLLKFIDRTPWLNSLREDVLPWLAKARWQHPRLAEKLGLLEILRGGAGGSGSGGGGSGGDGNEEAGDAADNTTSTSAPATTTPAITATTTAAAGAAAATTTEAEDDHGTAVGEGQSETVFDVGSMSTTRTRSCRCRGSQSATTTLAIIPPITAYTLAKPTGGAAFMRRVDTVQLYHFANLALAKTDPTQPPPPPGSSGAVKIDPSATIAEKAIVTAMDCLVADKVSIGPKAIVKKSVVGSGCSIGAGVRVMGCVLMDGVAVAHGASLEGCTVGRKAYIGAKCVLRDCEVADGFLVDEGTEAKNERFVAFSAASELDDDDDDDEGASDEDDDQEAVATDNDAKHSRTG